MKGALFNTSSHETAMEPPLRPRPHSSPPSLNVAPDRHELPVRISWSVASYRDSELESTLLSAFHQAHFPDCLLPVVLWQGELQAPCCMCRGVDKSEAGTRSESEPKRKTDQPVQRGSYDAGSETRKGGGDPCPDCPCWCHNTGRWTEQGSTQIESLLTPLKRPSFHPGAIGSEQLSSSQREHSCCQHSPTSPRHPPTHGNQTGTPVEVKAVTRDSSGVPLPSAPAAGPENYGTPTSEGIALNDESFDLWKLAQFILTRQHCEIRCHSDKHGSSSSGGTVRWSNTNALRERGCGREETLQTERRDGGEETMTRRESGVLSFSLERAPLTEVVGLLPRWLQHCFAKPRSLFLEQEEARTPQDEADRPEGDRERVPLRSFLLSVSLPSLPDGVQTQRLCSALASEEGQPGERCAPLSERPAIAQTSLAGPLRIPVLQLLSRRRNCTSTGSSVNLTARRTSSCAPSAAPPPPPPAAALQLRPSPPAPWTSSPRSSLASGSAAAARKGSTEEERPEPGRPEDGGSRGVWGEEDDAEGQREVMCIAFMDWRESRGPCFARAICEALLPVSPSRAAAADTPPGEERLEFLLQTDSHMRFAPHFDCFLLNQLKLAAALARETPQRPAATSGPSCACAAAQRLQVPVWSSALLTEKVLLTGYPPAYDEGLPFFAYPRFARDGGGAAPGLAQPNMFALPKTQYPGVLLCADHFDARDLLRTKGRLLRPPEGTCFASGSPRASEKAKGDADSGEESRESSVAICAAQPCPSSPSRGRGSSPHSRSPPSSAESYAAPPADVTDASFPPVAFAKPDSPCPLSPAPRDAGRGLTERLLPMQQTTCTCRCLHCWGGGGSRGGRDSADRRMTNAPSICVGDEGRGDSSPHIASGPSVRCERRTGPAVSVAPVSASTSPSPSRACRLASAGTRSAASPAPPSTQASAPCAASSSCAANSFAPLESRFWAAGFSFGPARVSRDVGYDPQLQFVFFGEEQTMGMRLFTHGWRLFSPRFSALFHLWTRAHRPFFKTDLRRLFATAEQRQTSRCDDASSSSVAPPALPASSFARLVAAGEARVDRVLAASSGSEAHLRALGLGTARAPEEYWTHIGVDPRTRAISGEARDGGHHRDLFLTSSKEQQQQEDGVQLLHALLTQQGPSWQPRAPGEHAKQKAHVRPSDAAA
ncbi:hypothetical protein BESB_078750 [Besnoitia besnoiti]|uniref:Uncharacterized protein n=1 Tax=Besnoitia besnoiti TaxID=94643 RepID=A0A2A9M6T1_BESBE|nr:hypothetical protein BESB_078750 [Besnoitia besnoiti]PFH33659.1 hypothetical protein BESB_078750 [Besnoitia besnoiti]